ISAAYTIAFQRSVSSLGRSNRLVLHSFVLGRQPTLCRFNGVGLGFLDCVALGRAAQRWDDDGEAAIRLGERDGLEPYHDIQGDRMVAIGYGGFCRGTAARSAGL